MAANTQVLLISPCRFLGQNEEGSVEFGKKYMPLGLLYLGSYLEQCGYKVKIVDAPMDRNFKDTIASHITESLMLVGLSVMTVHLASALEITRFIKGLRNNIPVVWGGIHPTLHPEQTCQHELVDFVVYGDGELPMEELLKQIGKNDRLEEIKGLLYKRNGAVVFNRELYAPLDINTLPVNYDLLEVEKYILKNVDITGARGGDIKRAIQILTGIGCPYPCTFCINTIKAKKRYRRKSVERILQEIDLAVDRYGAEFIMFEDEIFFLDKTRVCDLLDAMEQRNYKLGWCTTIRADFYKSDMISEQLLERIRKNGCSILRLGIESGSPRMLEVYKKQITLDQVRHAAKLNYKHGFYASYAFIVGSPGEKEHEVFQTLKFAQQIKNIDPRGTMIFHTFRPQPGCDLYHQALALGFHGPESLEGWAELAENSLRGYCSLQDLPWLTKAQANLYEFLAIYAESAFQDLRRFKKILAIPAWLARQAFIIRLNNNFWRLLIEMKIYYFLKRHGLFKYIREVFYTPKMKH